MNAADFLDLEAIRNACREHGVRRLRVFGSAMSDRFDPVRSDVDFLVDFVPGRGETFEDYFGLRESLVEIVGRDVDLVVTSAVQNPYFKAAALHGARDPHAA